MGSPCHRAGDVEEEQAGAAWLGVQREVTRPERLLLHGHLPGRGRAALAQQANDLPANQSQPDHAWCLTDATESLDSVAVSRYNLPVSKVLVKSHSRDSSSGPGNVMAPGRLPSLHTRMKARRSQLGLTGAELAQRAGISPSYVSLIENGAKTPDEGVAAALARALEDDEALYRAWARAARLGLHDLELLNQIEVISRTPAYMDLVESGEELPKLDPPGARSRDEDPSRRASAGGGLAFDGPGYSPRFSPLPGGHGGAEPVLQVPILPEGGDRRRRCLPRRPPWIRFGGSPPGRWPQGRAIVRLRGHAPQPEAPAWPRHAGRSRRLLPRRLACLPTGSAPSAPARASSWPGSSGRAGRCSCCPAKVNATSTRSR